MEYGAPVRGQEVALRGGDLAQFAPADRVDGGVLEGEDDGVWWDRRRRGSGGSGGRVVGVRAQDGFVVDMSLDELRLDLEAMAVRCQARGKRQVAEAHLGGGKG